MPAAALAVVLASAFISSCGPSGAVERDGRPSVAVSILPQTWLVERIGTDRWTVLTLVPPGESPATFQPPDALITRFMRTALYFRIGVPFEEGAWFQAIAGGGGPAVVDLRENVPVRRMRPRIGRRAGAGGVVEAPEPLAARSAHAGFDPHIWLSPALLKIQAGTVADAFIRFDPEHAGEYRANLARTFAELDTLDADISGRLTEYRGRRFYVFHPSWGYFADAYGLRQEAVEMEGKEPSEADLTALLRKMRQEDVTVLFVQPQIRGTMAATLAAAIGGRVEVLNPLAPDIPGNLRRVAAALAEALR